MADLSHRYKVFGFSVEIAARGLITKQNKSRLKSFSLRCADIGSVDARKLIANCSKASLLASFSIFQARNEPTWSSPMPLVVQSGSWLSLLGDYLARWPVLDHNCFLSQYGHLLTVSSNVVVRYISINVLLFFLLNKTIHHHIWAKYIQTTTARAHSRGRSIALQGMFS